MWLEACDCLLPAAMKLEDAVRKCSHGAKRSLEVIVTFDDREGLWYKECFSQFCEAWATEEGASAQRAFFSFGSNDLPQAFQSTRNDWKKVKICEAFSSCTSISYLAWVDSDGAIVPAPNSETNKHRMEKLSFPGLRTIFDEAAGVDRGMVSFVGYRELGAHDLCSNNGTVGAQSILGLPKHCPCQWLYAAGPGAKHHTFNAGVFVLKLPEASTLMSKWMGLIPARFPADAKWAGKTSEQWFFDRYLAHERCVKLVKEVDLAVRSPGFGPGWGSPFVHFYGANAFHGKRDIRLFCHYFVENIGRPSLLEALPAVQTHAAEYIETSQTEAAILDASRIPTSPSRNDAQASCQDKREESIHTVKQRGPQ